MHPVLSDLPKTNGDDSSAKYWEHRIRSTISVLLSVYCRNS